MRDLYFKNNEFLLKNNFSTILKAEITEMVFDYFKNLYIVPLDPEIFDKEISDLIIKLHEKIDDLKKKRRINKCKEMLPCKFNKPQKETIPTKRHIYKNYIPNKKTVYINVNSKKYLKSSKKFIK